MGGGGEEGTDLVDSNRLPVQPYLIHYPRSILRILLTDELNEAITLMCLRDSVLGEMYIHYSTSLEHELPDQAVCNSLVDVAYVDSGFFVLLPIYIIRTMNVIRRGKLTNA